MNRTLRAQIALATALVALVVVALAGALIALRIDHRDRTIVDAQLAARAERVTADIDKLLIDGNSNQPGDDGYGDLLDGSESLVRLFDGATLVAQRGAIPDQPLMPPAGSGLSTITVDGAPWRSYVVSSRDGIRLQVLQSLQPVNDRRTANTRLVILVTLLAALVSGAAGWLVGSRVLRPLHRLTSGAVAIANDPDPNHRLPAVTGPAEVAALSTTLNGMLDRLGASTETTRQFAADVGHELRGPLTASTTYLETLLTSVELTADARQAVAAAHEQQQRMVATLGALQVLARGDARALPPPTDLEPGLLVEELVRLARRRHPQITFTLNDSTDGATVSGWSDGLRIAIDNLLNNAAVHGRPAGTVDVSVHANDGHVAVCVEDDGPGIDPNDLDLVRKRFMRRAAATTPGSGLGLALVDQQALLHGGSLTLANSKRGGLRAELRLASTP
ncbi:MAG TPA: HAMP domain-containing sensor histidine kinase [Nocardioidaceae bacterium]